MARIYPLFSSSSGNSIFIGNASSGILIDAGVSYKRLCEGMAVCGLDITAVKAVFVTHDHSDHISGLKILTKKHDIPVYALPYTLQKLEGWGYINSTGCEVTPLVSIEGMEVSFFPTPHDTDESCGYRIKTPDGKVCAVCTDLGYITSEVDRGIVGCNLVMLEANYDENMLRNGRYPYPLKKRIASEHGHLSNNDCAKQVKRLVENGTVQIILGHLSKENNTPETADRTVCAALEPEFSRNKDYILEVAPIETKGKCIVF